MLGERRLGGGAFGPRLFQLDGDSVQPVEAEVGLGEVESPAPGRLDQAGDRSHDASVEGAQSMLSGLFRQQVVLYRQQQHLGNLPADVERLVVQQPSARRVVQAQLP